MENRISRLSDPGYETSLKSDVGNLQQKCFELENLIRKHEAHQKLRSKELETVMETGERKEVKREFFEISKEIAIYSQKVESLKEKRKQMKKTKKEVQEKLRELEKNNESRDVSRVEPPERDFNLHKEAFVRVQKMDKAVEGKYSSGLKLLELKVKKLSEELAKSKEDEMKVMRLLGDKNKEFSEKQLVLSDLQITATVTSVKKSQKNSLSYGDDMMFLTEKEY